MKNERTMNLTEHDRKIIRFESRIGYIFFALVLMSGVFLNLFVAVSSEFVMDYNTLFWVSAGIVVLGFLILYLVNRKYYADLRDGEKVVRKEQVQSKYTEKPYGAGRVATPNPGLRGLFSKLRGQEMGEPLIHYLNINGCRHEVEKELYDRIKAGDFVNIYFSKHSETWLEISISNG